jgi:hypothetical protein
MNKFRHLLACALLALAFTSANATTVIAPDFNQLVNDAELIFQGTVTDVKSQWIGEGAERRIVSYVTFKVEDSIKGNAGSNYTMRMLGGTVDGQTLEVTDAPKFKNGDRDILFVQNNGSQFVPLVGIMHGRFHVTHDENGRDVLVTGKGSPLTDVAELGKEHSAAGKKSALTVDDFKAAIHSHMRGGQSTAKQP